MNTKYYDALRVVPRDALKDIKAGRLKGRSDINPQWRYERMTEVFGPCGDGWKVEIVKVWTEPAPHEQLLVFVHVNVFVVYDGKWSEPIPGFGGDFIVKQESTGLYVNDEAVKMATTDAIGTAMRLLGVAGDIYRGLANDSKYGRTQPPQQQPNYSVANSETTLPADTITEGQKKKMLQLMQETGVTKEAVRTWIRGKGKTMSSELTKAEGKELLEWMEGMRMENIPIK